MNVKLAFYSVLILLGITLYTQAQTTNYQVYALFVVNIAKYSSWPGTAGAGELKVTVFGKSKVYDELLKQNGKNINGQVLKIEQTEKITEIGQPHILYLTDGKS